MPTYTKVNDTFTEASNTALDSHTPDTGTGWTEWWNDTASVTAQVIGGSGVVRPSANENDNGIAYYAQPDPGTADQDVEVVLGGFRDQESGVFCRTTSRTNGYLVRLDASGIELIKIVSGTTTQLASYSDGDKRNDTIKFECRDSAKRVLQNTVERISNADNVLTAVGKWGLWWGDFSNAFEDIGSSDDYTEFTALDDQPPGGPKGPLGHPFRGPFGGPI